jgi:hypothetical protein
MATKKVRYPGDAIVHRIGTKAICKKSKNGLTFQMPIVKVKGKAVSNGQWHAHKMPTSHARAYFTSKEVWVLFPPRRTGWKGGVKAFGHYSSKDAPIRIIGHLIYLRASESARKEMRAA